jgi:SAM-dependent methyltransferase
MPELEMSTSSAADEDGLRPDGHSNGFLHGEVDPLRYDGQPNDPDEVVGVIIDMIPKGARVLDVGCGTGSVSVQILANGAGSLIGVEPDEARASKARERGVDARTGILTPALIEELGKFDIVLFADVLEHLPDPHAMLELAKTALAPGGQIVASVPNIAHWSVRTELLRGNFDYRKWGIMDATHLRWFTDSTIRLLFESAGMKIERRRVTAGIDLDCYLERLPWTKISRSTRSAFIRRAIRRWPQLFGCQLVVRSAPVASARGN